MTIWVLHLGPRVPDSSRGLQKYTQRESTYRRALTLSRALTTRSREPQNESSNTSSVSGDTLFCRALTLTSGLMAAAALAATADFALHSRHHDETDAQSIGLRCNAFRLHDNTDPGQWLVSLCDRQVGDVSKKDGRALKA